VGFPRFLVMGEAPGEEEVKQKRPFIGPTGSMLRKVLDKLPFGYRLTNTVLCFPEDGKLLESVKRKCIDLHLKQEIEKFDYFLLVGGTALEAVFGGIDKGIMDLAGHILVDAKGKKYIPIVHPSFYYRQGIKEIEDSRLKDWIKDIIRIVSVVEKKDKLPFEYEIVRDVKKIEGLKKEKVLVFDVETSSLDTQNCVVYTLSISGLDGKIYIVEDIDLVKEILEDRDKTFIMHNASFEYKVLFQKGIKMKGKIYDTMLMAGLINQNRDRSFFGLKNLAKQYLKYKYFRLIPDLKNIESCPYIYEYNAEDVYVTRELYKLLTNLLTEKQMNFVDKVLSSAIKVISEIEMIGIMIDKEKVNSISNMVKSKSQEVEEKLKQIANMDMRSSVQIGKFIEAELNNELETKDIVETSRTESLKQLSVDEFTLTEIRKRTKNEKVKEFISLLLEYRKWEKMQQTFLKNFIKYLSADSRIRAKYDLMGTRSGRLSSSSPNLQNIPKNLRVVFIPKEGYKFLEADLSQIEMRIAGILAEDKIILKAYKDNEDLHILTASVVAGISKEEVTDKMRQSAKAINFGLLYGMQAPSFKDYASKEYGIEYSIEEAEKIRERFFTLYSGLKNWHKRVEEQIKKYHCIESPFGRVYIFEDESDDFSFVIRQALNYPVQSSSSDLNLYIMGKLFEWRDKENVDFNFVGSVHDSMLLEVREDYLNLVEQKIKEIVKNVSNEFDWITIPIEVETEVKNNWKGDED